MLDITALVTTALASTTGTGRRYAPRKWDPIVDQLTPLLRDGQWTAAKTAQWAVEKGIIPESEQLQLRCALSRRKTKLNKALLS